MLYNQVLCVLEKLVPLKRKKGKGKLLWKRLAKARTIHQVSECLQNMWKLESELASGYSSINDMEEDTAVLKIKS